MVFVHFLHCLLRVAASHKGVTSYGASTVYLTLDGDFKNVYKERLHALCNQELR